MDSAPITPPATADELAAQIPRTPRRRSPWRWIVPLPPQSGGGRAFFVRWLVRRTFLFYLAICLMLALLQRSLIYHPARAGSMTAAAAGFRDGVLFDVLTHGSAGELHGWHMLSHGQTAATGEEAGRLLAEAPLVVLYFPGNAGSRAHRLGDLQLLSDLGAHVLLFDYRGYADNPGAPSETALHEDAFAIWTHLTEVRHVAADRIVLFGESLGGGVATHLAANLCRTGQPPAGLVLRATFSSLGDAAARHFPWLPVRWLLRDTFRSTDAIRDTTCPILHLHGTRDTIVPIDLGKKLFAAAPERSASGVPKTFVELARADHNDILYVSHGQFQSAIRRFFASF